jgi:hypothetical protein
MPDVTLPLPVRTLPLGFWQPDLVQRIAHQSQFRFLILFFSARLDVPELI